MTPLALAAGMHGRGNARIVNILLECGADPMQGVPLDKCKLMWQLRRQVAPDLRGSFVLPSELVQPESKRQLGPAPILRPGSGRPPPPPPPPPPAASALAPIPAATTPVSVGPNSSSASGSSAPQPARRALYPLDFAAAAGNRDAVALLLQRYAALVVRGLLRSDGLTPRPRWRGCVEMDGWPACRPNRSPDVATAWSCLATPSSLRSCSTAGQTCAAPRNGSWLRTSSIVVRVRCA